MSNTFPIDILAALTGRTASQVRAYLQVGSFDEAHETDEALPPIEMLRAVEVLVASTVARMYLTRIEMVRLVKKVMREFIQARDLRTAQSFPQDDDSVLPRSSKATH